MRNVSLVVFVAIVLALAAVAQDSPPAQTGPATQNMPATPTNPAATADSSAANGGAIDSSDPLLQPPPLPKGNPTLIGGVVNKLDKVHESVTVKPFGGRNMRIFFDERTHIYRDGVETTMLGIRRGDRVYLDTMLDGSRVFAKSIRVETRGQTADARGQILSYDAKDGRLELRDELSSHPVAFRVSSDTVIHLKDRTGSTGDLVPGSLVAVRFIPEAPGRGTAREVDIYASPGSMFTFVGKLTHLDMSRGILALNNSSDGKSYEIHFEPTAGVYDSLGVGSDVTVSATFDGQRYTAHNITASQSKK